MSSNVFVSKHPLVQLKVAELRAASNTPRQVRELTDAIGRLLMYEVTQDLPLTTSGEKRSPVGTFEGRSLATRQALVPILRSGLSLLSAASDLLHDAEIRHLGLFREEATLMPVEYYNKLPRECAVDECLILDPMIATGGTAVAAIEMLKLWGAPKIKFVSICASRNGIEMVAKKFPDVTFYVAVVDDTLDKNGFVVPGIGDCGDRLNNTA
ncbi:hypothetical protein GGI25_002693 [Coemansia spiralis]|uniref:uracil phosphoribosyltransferase n=2 Tax=Coemansia TaxID=4863 RepID=A0A9W8GA40_9FUNG|nr:putative uracil phosphoribosyltransferase [Coemansia spiralis]KAJ1992869.1 hypothetical protein EDC05_002501 [Coemansia umbellata]KAJ2622804.1 hypothetical protein GGI26_002911 [Coemansia sp. RSA 1358]KAJ2678050.1 hypothetical protein GGI25_002693 [Coemansia spiralis]